MDMTVVKDRPVPALAGFDQAFVERVRGLSDLREGLKNLPAVVALGPKAIPALETLLRGRSESLYQPRCLYADAIAAIGGPEAIDALLRALDDCVARELPPPLDQAEIAVVNRIAEHLGSTGSLRVIEPLLAALRQRNYPGCALALGRLREPGAIPLLIRCLADDVARESAVRALRRLGQPALPALVAAAQAQHPGAAADSALETGRAAAVELLGRIGGRHAHPPLLRALNDPNRQVRFAAACALVQNFGPDRNLAIKTLVDLLDDEDWAHAERVAQVIASQGIAAMRELACTLARPVVDPEGGRRRARAEPLLRRMRRRPR